MYVTFLKLLTHVKLDRLVSALISPSRLLQKANPAAVIIGCLLSYDLDRESRLFEWA
jgi:hypothetical protein